MSACLVFTAGDIAHVMKLVFDPPVCSRQRQQLGRASLLRSMTGNRTVSIVFLPRTIRSRVMRQTCPTPVQSDARCLLIESVVSIRRVSIRPMVSVHLRSGGADHTDEGGKRPEGLFDIGFQGGLVALH